VFDLPRRKHAPVLTAREPRSPPRDANAELGLTPKSHSSGGKDKLGRFSKRGACSPASRSQREIQWTLLVDPPSLVTLG